MKTLVVYDSVYGNTEIVARSIGDAILGEVQVLRVSQVKTGDWDTVDLLVIGSPTHGALPTDAVQGLVHVRHAVNLEIPRALGWFCRAQTGRSPQGKGLDARWRTGRFFRQGSEEGTAQAGGGRARCRLGKRT
jgi:menaquinone-dependent protoporphyrinogen IX oxidase